MSITNTSAIYYQTKTSVASATSSTKTSDSSDSFRNLVQESVVDEFKRKNPDHASHVDQQVKAGRAVRNPFFGWGDNAGSIVYERFGASIEEHRGEGFGKAALRGSQPEDDDDDEEEDWWIKRHKRMKKLMKEQVERSIKRDIAQKSAAQEEYARQQYVSRQRQHCFLTEGTPDAQAFPAAESPSASMTAVTAYTSILDLFVGNTPV